MLDYLIYFIILAGNLNIAPLAVSITNNLGNDEPRGFSFGV